MCLVLCAFVFSPLSAFAVNTTQTGIENAIDDAVDWAKREHGIPSEYSLLNDPLLQEAGSEKTDWYALALARAGIGDNYPGYLEAVTRYVKEKYQQPGRLDANKATEWHRISLAMLAAGGDPANVDGINLILDGIYDKSSISLGKQGINGWIWALITLDSVGYVDPEGDQYYSREEILGEILVEQNSDGGFSLSGSRSDADITAMAVTALATYYNDENTYRYTQNKTGKLVTKNIAQVVDEALDALSQMQDADGGFSSAGAANAESCAQVLIALGAVNRDPKTDREFIKNNNTILDALLRYQTADGGFAHISGGAPDSMATAQAICGLNAYLRQQDKDYMFYDFSGWRTSYPEEEQPQATSNPNSGNSSSGSSNTGSSGNSGSSSGTSSGSTGTVTRPQATTKPTTTKKPTATATSKPVVTTKPTTTNRPSIASGNYNTTTPPSVNTRTNFVGPPTKAQAEAQEKARRQAEVQRAAIKMGRVWDVGDNTMTLNLAKIRGAAQEQESVQNKISVKWVIVIAILILLVLAFGGYYIYRKKRKTILLSDAAPAPEAASMPESTETNEEPTSVSKEDMQENTHDGAEVQSEARDKGEGGAGFKDKIKNSPQTQVIGAEPAIEVEPLFDTEPKETGRLGAEPAVEHEPEFKAKTDDE